MEGRSCAAPGKSVRWTGQGRGVRSSAFMRKFVVLSERIFYDLPHKRRPTNTYGELAVRRAYRILLFDSKFGAYEFFDSFTPSKSQPRRPSFSLDCQLQIEEGTAQAFVGNELS